MAFSCLEVNTFLTKILHTYIKINLFSKTQLINYFNIC